MSRPLLDKRIVITRSPKQAAKSSKQLSALGAIPIVFPTILFVPLPSEPLDEALAQIDRYNWLLFTSSTAVEYFFARLATCQQTVALPPIAASGKATAKALRRFGAEAVFIPDEFVGEALVAGLGLLTNQAVLLPRSRIGRPQIVDLLEEQGARVNEIALYDTVPATPTAQAIAELQTGVDVVTFASPSSVRNFLAMAERHNLRADLFGQRAAQVACIGPVTAQQARDCGLEVAIQPEIYTMDGLIEALVAYFSAKSTKTMQICVQN